MAGKGNPKTGGRQKGGRNKVTLEGREFAKRLTADPKYRAKLRERLKEGKIAPAVESMLWHYAYGKPKEVIEGDLHATLSIRWEGEDE